MGENVGLFPAEEIEGAAGFDEFETGFGEVHAVFALKHTVEMTLQIVKIKDVGGSIIKLRVAQLLIAPVRALLLLAEIDVEQFARQLLQPMAIGIGPHEARGDLGAVN